MNRAKRDDRATVDEKDGRARIVDPPRYEEVGITGLLAAVMTIIVILKFKYRYIVIVPIMNQNTNTTLNVLNRIQIVTLREPI